MSTTVQLPAVHVAVKYWRVRAGSAGVGHPAQSTAAHAEFPYQAFEYARLMATKARASAGSHPQHVAPTSVQSVGAVQASMSGFPPWHARWQASSESNRLSLPSHPP
jgi:hypothetical protein